MECPARAFGSESSVGAHLRTGNSPFEYFIPVPERFMPTCTYITAICTVRFLDRPFHRMWLYLGTARGGAVCPNLGASDISPIFLKSRTGGGKKRERKKKGKKEKSSAR
ncbi:unnamed protein product [Tuber aestivum]|uniref:Uncharacterized protein n=1 Tax=Tuber aestivum TaxID=59557 RepID=A0A292PKV3_9PEZI|nr:unnamed protein product [Tuber aestivum]